LAKGKDGQSESDFIGRKGGFLRYERCKEQNPFFFFDSCMDNDQQFDGLYLEECTNRIVDIERQ
jgi:hypothetical protein